MVAWGGSSILFLGELGSSLSGLCTAPLQMPRFLLGETLYRPRNDQLGAKEVEWVVWLRQARGVGGATRPFPFYRWSCTEAGTSDRPFVTCGTSFFDAGVQAGGKPAWLRVTCPLAKLER